LLSPGCDKAIPTPYNLVAKRILENMDSDEDMQDVEMPSLPSFAKGKGKAVDKGNNYDDDNLPWCVFTFTSKLSLMCFLGWKSTVQ
jgi:hypothetical protein